MALSFLCILVDIAKSLFEKEISGEIAAVDPVYFVDGSFRYYHFDRIGGVLSHLRKIYRTEIVAQLGEDHDALYNIETTDLIRADNSDVCKFLPLQYERIFHKILKRFCDVSHIGKFEYIFNSGPSSRVIFFIQPAEYICAFIYQVISGFFIKLVQNN